LTNKATPYHNALVLADQLTRHHKLFNFFSYQSDEHLFTNGDFQQAVKRDLNWFKSHGVTEIEKQTLSRAGDK